MNPDTLEKLLLLIGGGVLTVVGAWLNDWRSEKRRKGTKLEEAYIAWLNSHSLVLGRLKKLATLAENEPASGESYDLLLEKLSQINSDLQNLLSALHAAFIYERDRSKKRLVELHSIRYAALVEILTIIIRHHKTHLEFHETIENSNTVISYLKELQESEGVSVNADLAKEIAKVQKSAQRNHNKATKHLSGCTASLSTYAKKILKVVDEIDNESPVLRRALAE